MVVVDAKSVTITWNDSIKLNEVAFLLILVSGVQFSFVFYNKIEGF